MNSKLKLFLIIFAIGVIFLIFVFPNYKREGGLVVTPLPSPTPKTYIFDSSSDLKKELDSVDPLVLDSDFE